MNATSCGGTSPGGAARCPADGELHALIAGLRADSRRFAGLWDGHEVGVHVADAKTVRHPEVGPVELTCDVLTAPGTDLRLILFTPVAGTAAEDKLRRLAGALTPVG